MEIFNLNNPNFYILVVLSIVNSAILCFVASKLFQIMQLSGYKLSGYWAWLKDTKIKFVGRLIMLSFLSLISVLVTNSVLNGFGGYYSYLGLIFYFYFCVIFIINIAKLPQKTPLKQTRRMNRLIIVTFVLMALITFGTTTITTEFLNLLKYGIVVLTPLFLPFIVPFANIIISPVEAIVRNYYIKKAKSKLKKMPNLIKIGITGSFGKTTTKHILNILLSKKYSVCMTPHSFNTPMGLTKVILKYLKWENQVLIAEMGAKQVGDIKYLCKLINPKHAIITSVGSQHLLTFGSEENIAKTKNELVDAIDDGIVVFNGSNSGSKKLYDMCAKEKYLSGINLENVFCNISNVNVTTNGSTFVLEINGEKANCETVLLGKSNLQDIAMASVLAYKLGVSLNEIAEAITTIKPMSHRLELIKNNNGLIIIDSSYNSSQESSKSSLEVLAMFKSGKKIIVTPGLVEMGDREKFANLEFAKDISDVCDIVIIVNKVNKEALTLGLQDKNFNMENVYYVDDLADVKELLPKLTKKGDIVLFENDLPDNYT